MESVVFEQKVLNLLQSIQKDINEVKHEVEYIKKQVSEEYLTVEEEKLLEDLFKACEMFQLRMKKKILTKDLEDVNKQLEFMIRQKLLS